ncbi:hypothetical protein SAMN05216600_101325 [Pseudomonas cuatrocienegasensis]|uniref:Uncharacterized protein n=1 Tax=Pseudomonas cuatrocienegasensis TaxID=543360 RepID=A0ABY1B1E3_9PSED|nr:hypothetical protein SAMN05216600_101325 [Pseudomonas cuatrocienegasensis]
MRLRNAIMRAVLTVTLLRILAVVARGESP